MQEELFTEMQNISLQIPKDFYETCIVDENPHVTKVPDPILLFMSTSR